MKMSFLVIEFRKTNEGHRWTDYEVVEDTKAALKGLEAKLKPLIGTVYGQYIDDFEFPRSKLPGCEERWSFLDAVTINGWFPRMEEKGNSERETYPGIRHPLLYSGNFLDLKLELR